MTTPKIHFRYAFPLDSDRRKVYEMKNIPYPSVKEVMEKTSYWSTLWQEYEGKHQIINQISELLSVDLLRDQEVSVFGAGLNPMSNPFIIPIMNKLGYISDDAFIEIMVHELVHRFVADRSNNSGIEKYWGQIKSEYSQESLSTINHLIIYAVVEILIGKIFGEDKKENIVMAYTDDYKKALNIVREKSPEHFIEQFRSFMIK